MDGFGSRLKECRALMGLTQEALGKKVGMSAQKISNIERGYTTGLGVGDMLLLSDALGVSSDYLIKGEGTYSDDAERPVSGIRSSAEKLNSIVPNEAGIEKARSVREGELLAAFRALSSTGKGAGLTEDAIKLAAAFDELDGRGKGAVWGCLNDEQERIKSKAKKEKPRASSDGRAI